MRHQLSTRDGHARTISDFTTRLGFLRQDSAESVYGRMGLEDTVAISFAGVGALVGIALSDRWERFSDRDRAVLDLVRPHLARAWRSVATSPLTPREIQVVQLVAEGLTDAQIATALRVRRRTVSKHLEHVYDKLRRAEPYRSRSHRRRDGRRLGRRGPTRSRRPDRGRG